MDVVIQPKAVDQIKGFFTALIVFIEGFVKLVRQDTLDRVFVGSHILNQAKPAQISFLGNGVFRSKVAGIACAHIHAPDFEGFRPFFCLAENLSAHYGKICGQTTVFRQKTGQIKIKIIQQKKRARAASPIPKSFFIGPPPND